MKDDRRELASAERGNFLKLTAAGGFTAAMVAGAGGVLWSSEAVAQTAKEERERENAADHVMTIATAYVLGASRSYPIMQLDLKENIQNATPAALWCRKCRAEQSRPRSIRCRISRRSRRPSTSSTCPICADPISASQIW